MTNHDVHFTSPHALEAAFVGAMEQAIGRADWIFDLADAVADNVVSAIWRPLGERV